MEIDSWKKVSRVQRSRKIVGFYPKLKHRSKPSQSAYDYDPYSSTDSTTCLLIPDEGPIRYVPPPLLLNQDKSSNIDFLDVEIDDHADYGIKHEQTLLTNESDQYEGPKNGHVLISSFPLPRVNGITAAPIVAVRYGFRNASTQTRPFNLMKEYLPGIAEHKIWRSQKGDPFIEVTLCIFL